MRRMYPSRLEDETSVVQGFHNRNDVCFFPEASAKAGTFWGLPASGDRIMNFFWKSVRRGMKVHETEVWTGFSNHVMTGSIKTFIRWFLFLVNFSDDFCRNASHYYAVRYVFRYNGAGRYHWVFSDGDARQEGRMSIDWSTFLDMNRTRDQRLPIVRDRGCPSDNRLTRGPIRTLFSIVMSLKSKKIQPKLMMTQSWWWHFSESGVFVVVDVERSEDNDRFINDCAGNLTEVLPGFCRIRGMIYMDQPLFGGIGSCSLFSRIGVFMPDCFTLEKSLEYILFQEQMNFRWTIIKWKSLVRNQ